MQIKISDIDVLTDDNIGNNRFVVFTDDKIELEIKKIIPAEAVVSDAKDRFECEIYRPAPNNEKEPPHIHLRAKSALRLKEKLKVGDLVVVEN
ncbi:hypothetical protein [Shimia sp. MIT910701]|uniref:hypothetical protein n=1 Tax=Shimia sp. MIT910701 TaxID=3096987 RepID=UPI00399B18C4